jgi:hypothetical protein
VKTKKPSEIRGDMVCDMCNEGVAELFIDCRELIKTKPEGIVGYCEACWKKYNDIYENKKAKRNN